VFSSDPNEPATIEFAYSPVTQTVQGCNAVEWNLFVKDGVMQVWNEAAGFMETQDNWVPVMEYLHNQNVQVNRNDEDKLSGYTLIANITSFHDLQVYTNNVNDTILTIQMAWITRDENTQQNITDHFTLSLEGGLDACRNQKPTLQQQRP
jgi:hypothetical protein